jgi:hypothetical protein
LIGYPPPGTGIENFNLDAESSGAGGGLGDIDLVDCMVGFYREPDTFTVHPGDDLQAVIDQLIPGDTLIISGTHKVDLLVRVKGTQQRHIVIRGDGTAKIQGPFGDDSVFGRARRCPAPPSAAASPPAAA